VLPEQITSVEAALSSLTVRLSGLQRDASIHIALFSRPEGFPDNHSATRTIAVETQGSRTEIRIENLQVGTYAAAVFQDLNEDGVLTKGAFGIPSEPYGFSNNARGRFGPPSFQAAAFKLSNGNSEMDIGLR
jgi:uncharacterized protein (DUF2141 family)